MESGKRCYRDEDTGEIIQCYNIRIATLGAIAIIAANIALLYLFMSIDNLFAAIASIGIVTFIGVLALADYVSIEHSISTGEMRSAMTASITVVYLVMVALAFAGNPSDASTASKVIEHFTWVMGIVVIFYFGSKGVLQYIEARNIKDEREAKKKAGKPKPKSDSPSGE